MMLPRNTLCVAGLVSALAAPAAFADLFTASPTGPSSLTPKVGPDRDTRHAIGDEFGAEVTIFNSTGGAYLADDVDPLDPELAVFGTPTSIGNNFQDRSVMVDSSQTEVSPTEYLYQITWEMADGDAFFPEGVTLGGNPITQIAFEMGGGNAVADPIEGVGGTITGILDPFDPVNDAYLSEFELFDSTGTSLFSGSFFANIDASGGVSGSTSLSAGDTDLSTLDIARATATINVSFAPIPEPASAGVLGLAAMGLLVRRRRD